MLSIFDNMISVEWRFSMPTFTSTRLFVTAISVFDLPQEGDGHDHGGENERHDADRSQCPRIAACVTQRAGCTNEQPDAQNCPIYNRTIGDHLLDSLVQRDRNGGGTSEAPANDENLVGR